MQAGGLAQGDAGGIGSGERDGLVVEAHEVALAQRRGERQRLHRLFQHLDLAFDAGGEVLGGA